MGTLTVRENLMFSANLRLPETVQVDEKRQRVAETLQDLGLENCADTKVTRCCDVLDSTWVVVSHKYNS
jgi:ATP-binding cassette subfamily G (WHITE) protein 2